MPSTMYDHKGYEVAPLSTDVIEHKSIKLRKIAQNNGLIDHGGQLDIVGLLEFSQITYDILPKASMGNAMGRTLPDGSIQIREDIYDGACGGNGRDRFTIAHELGHYVLHREQMGAMARSASESTKIYRNSEWQANEFGGRLLVPTEAIADKNLVVPDEIALIYGVSHECAQLRITKAQRR